MGMSAGVDLRARIQASLGSGPESGALTNLTVLPGEALVTATAVHGAVGFTSAPMQARVVLARIQEGCRMDRQCGEEAGHHVVCLPRIQT